MTVPLDTERRDDDAPAVAAATPEIAGRSLGAIAWGRLRQDKVALVGAGMIIFFILVAIFAPLLCRIFDVDPFSTNTDQLDDLGFPKGPWAGAWISSSRRVVLEIATSRC